MDVILRWKPGRTFAQALAAILVGDGTGLLDTEWTGALSTSAMAALVSALMIWAQGQTWLAEPKDPDQPGN